MFIPFSYKLEHHQSIFVLSQSLRSSTISQKKVAISLRFWRMAQMKSEAQGKRQRLSRYKQSPRSSLLARWDK